MVRVQKNVAHKEQHSLARLTGNVGTFAPVAGTTGGVAKYKNHLRGGLVRNSSCPQPHRPCLVARSALPKPTRYPSETVLLMKSLTPRSACPISYSLDLFGDKWTLLILRDMMLERKSSFSEFLCSPEKIASNILTSRLALLHAEGFVTKRTSLLNKSKFLYSLTDKAIALVPVLLEIAAWGTAYGPGGGLPDEVIKLGKSKAKTVATFQDKLRKERDAVLQDVVS